MLKNRALKKMGFTRKDINAMQIDNIIKLGEMGYTKADIEEMETETAQASDERVEELSAKIEELEKKLNINSVRSQAGTDVGTNADTSADEALKKLME